ncbi:cytochrome P450 [Mucidula mucida]|nr:cytochrome P450 [Mucidula mucida]
MCAPVHSQLYTALFVGILTTVGVLTFRNLRRYARLPPGPSWRNILGRLSSTHRWRTFHEWHQRFGPVISFHLGSQQVVVIGSASVAHDLLEVKGNIYSGRPRSVVGHEILSPLHGIGMSDGPSFRKWKMFLQAGMSPTSALGYRALQSVEASILMKELLQDQDPYQFRSRIRRFAASIIFCVAYGRRIKSLQEEVVIKQTRSGMYFAQVNVPGKFLVDSWPVLLYLPRFLQWFRWEPERRKALDSELYLSLMNEVRDKMKDGNAKPCMATYGLARQEEFGLNDLEAAYTLSASWAAGVGTTATTVEIFLMAMLLYPEVMKKAQAEIDFVVGRERMPGFQDQDKLPYIQALVKETTRWRCLAPTGFAHATTADDIYNGMLIPAGSTVYGNIFSMTQDEAVFPNPDEYSPERFLNTSNPTLVNFTTPFGFGRRLCPGMHVALQADYIAIVRILWAFNVKAPVDESGNRILPNPNDFSSGLVIGPAPFKCIFSVRDANTAEIILQDAERAEVEALDWP